MEDTQKFITFILGAGASFEVNMPTGQELTRKIASSFSFKSDDIGRFSGGDATLREALLELSYKSGTRGEHINAATLIGSAMPQAPSIDNFIDSHRLDPYVAECGKLAIAAEILKAERSSSIYVKPTSIYNKIDFDKVSGTWFNAFFQLLSLNSSLEELPNNLKKVRVISFNYDRTLEHFFYQSIQNYYGASSDIAAEIVSHLKIYHPYGKVGDLPWQNNGSGVHFGSDLSPSTLIQVSSGLRTFTEGTSVSDSHISAIRKSVFDAEILVFLGFAYHELNLDLLFDKESDSPARYPKQVFGTAMGISESNKKTIAQEIATLGKLHLAQITLRKELSAAQLLPEYSRTLRIPRTA